MNPFSDTISQHLKNTFNQAIDSLLQQGALTIPCKLVYSNTTNNNLCNNCFYDNISKLSSNLYNNTGPQPFPDNTICPICLGAGLFQNDFTEIVHMAVIFDSKYFMNWSSKSVQISSGLVQTICNINLMSKILDANEIIFDNSNNNINYVSYERAGHPEPCGFGDNRYIITMWKNK
jgi:hypothetical protein